MLCGSQGKIVMFPEAKLRDYYLKHTFKGNLCCGWDDICLSFTKSCAWDASHRCRSPSQVWYICSFTKWKTNWPWMRSIFLTNSTCDKYTKFGYIYIFSTVYLLLGCIFPFNSMYKSRLHSQYRLWIHSDHMNDIILACGSLFQMFILI